MKELDQFRYRVLQRIVVCSEVKVCERKWEQRSKGRSVVRQQRSQQVRVLPPPVE
jgi:hypothetical protein